MAATIECPRCDKEGCGFCGNLGVITIDELLDLEEREMEGAREAELMRGSVPGLPEWEFIDDEGPVEPMGPDPRLAALLNDTDDIELIF